MALSDEDIERARVLLSNTVGVLCRNSLRYGRELQVQGLIGVTVDGKQVFLVSINESFSQAENSSKVQEKNVGRNSVMDGHFLEDQEEFLVDKAGGNVNSHSQPQPKVPTLQSFETVHSLSASQSLVKSSRNQSGVGKTELSSRMEVSKVHSLTGINRHRRSAENSLHVSRSLCKESCQPRLDLSVDDVKHDADRPHLSNLRRWTDSQKCSAVGDRSLVDNDNESVCDAENCSRLSSRDDRDASNNKLLINSSSPQVVDSKRCSTTTVMQSDDVVQHDDVIEFVKREAESPTLTITSESSYCSTENGTKATENENLDTGSFEQVSNLVSVGQSYWQPNLQCDAAFSLNSLGVNVNTIGEPFWTVDEQEHVLRQNRNRMCDKSMALHQCEYANCGLRFCHRRHLLRHQTLKHGRPKGRISRFSALPLTVEALSAGCNQSFSHGNKTWTSLPTFLSEISD